MKYTMLCHEINDLFSRAHARVYKIIKRLHKASTIGKATTKMYKI